MQAKNRRYFERNGRKKICHARPSLLSYHPIAPLAKPMHTTDAIYRRLQRHLDAQPIGFPRDPSGSDIRLLTHHFTVEEARVALGMSYRFETAAEIHARLRDGGDPEQTRAVLDGMSARTSIMRVERDGAVRYCLLPLVIGMYEGKVFGLDREYARDFNDYANALQHGLTFASTEVMQMRVIPVETSLTPEQAILHYDDVGRLVRESEGPIVVLDCICRKKRALLDERCVRTERLETCLAFGDIAALLSRNGQGRTIGAPEARDILELNRRDGLVLQAYNMKRPEVICSCCGCCCGFLSVHRTLINPHHFWRTNFRARIDENACTRCRRCVKICQVDALSYSRRKKRVMLDPSRCIGCGNCVTVCAPGAVRLHALETPHVPPEDYEDLQETIMRHKPASRLGRIILRTLFGPPRRHTGP